MCECFAGSLLVSYSVEDPAMGRALESASAARAVHFLEEAVPDWCFEFCRSLPHRFAQVDVHPGHEQAAADRIRADYLEIALHHSAPTAVIARLRDPFQSPLIEIEAVATTSVSAGSAAGGGPFAFSAEHTAVYLPALGTASVTGTAAATHIPVVGVLDTGCMSAANLNVRAELDLTDKAPVLSAPDSFGHGSVVAAVLQDVAPAAELRIYKISTHGSAREWTFLAGLLAATADDCDVVNASVGFGLRDRSCAICGRDYGTTRARVFERLLQETLDLRPETTFVAAAGNASANEPAYPARIANAICVASTDGSGEVSTFSNRGAVDQDGNPHGAFVLAPGGDRLDTATGLGADRYVASYLGTDWRGTSFAAAYVSGILADHLTYQGRLARQSLAASLVSAADSAVIHRYNAQDHGAGEAKRL